MRSWEVNNPSQLDKVINSLEDIQSEFNAKQTDGRQVSFADLVVLGGCAGIEKAAKDAGLTISVPFTPGRMDALESDTDVGNFDVLEPFADGFRNYKKGEYAVETERMLIDRAHLLDLSAPELTALVGGLRVLDTNYDGSNYGVFTEKPGQLTNDFFVNLIDFDTKWGPVDEDKEFFEGQDRHTGETKWKATRSDLVFGSNPELRAIATAYGSNHGESFFVENFIKAWDKVMMLDRFELKNDHYKS